MWKAKRKSRRRKNDRKMYECEEFTQKREEFIAKTEQYKREFEEYLEKKEKQGVLYDEIINTLYYINHKDKIDEMYKTFRELTDESDDK